jgi:ABC-2 type transport system permease protein
MSAGSGATTCDLDHRSASTAPARAGHTMTEMTDKERAVIQSVDSDAGSAAPPARPAPAVAPDRRRPRSPLRRPLALWDRRRAVSLLLRRDLKIRYASSILGYLWSVLDPLLMALVYWFVFTQIFDRSVGAEPYIVFLLAGLLPWTWFNSAVHESARALRVDGKLVRSTNVPREVWVARVVLAKGAEFLFGLPVIALFAVIYSAEVNWRIVLLVPAVVMQAALLLGVGLILAPLVVLVRDLDRVVGILLRLAFYASPIIYAVEDAPGAWQTVVSFNPLAGIFELFRAAFFPGFLDWQHVAQAGVISFGLLVFGWCLFARLERTVLKEI